MDTSNNLFGKKQGAFHQFSRSRGTESLRQEGLVDEVAFGHSYATEAGPLNGEVFIKWYDVDGQALPVLECCDCCWGLFADFPEIFQKLAEVNGGAISPDEFCELLLACGFVDETDTTALDTATSM